MLSLRVVSCPENQFDLSTIATVPGLAALEYQAEVGSTNDWALELSADDDRAWPLLVLTSKQTGGRGRGVNRWWSADGALTYSLVIDAAKWNVPPERWPQAALVTGLAVCEALETLFSEGIFGLKWPNDVYLHGRKVCGILVETPSLTKGRIVVGVGINVNNSFFHAPEELRARATSLCDVAGGTFSLTETLTTVIERMLYRLDQLGANQGAFADDFRRYCLLTGQTIQVRQAQQQITGRCEGIDDHGALLLTTSCGRRQIFSGTVAAWGGG